MSGYKSKLPNICMITCTSVLQTEKKHTHMFHFHWAVRHRSVWFVKPFDDLPFLGKHLNCKFDSQREGRVNPNP